jgi:hypothetical protein
MIDLYDGNNVMRRATEKRSMPGFVPMGFRQRYEFTMAKPVGSQIWVWDGKGHNKRRQDIYPLYKSNREPMGEDIFSQIRLWRKALAHSHAIQITVEGWEADDVIGTLVRRRPHQCIVHTNDMDYGQVDDICTLNGVNLKGVPGRWVPLYKAMVGDSSDNIKGIPGFGHGRWEQLEDWWPQIERATRMGEPAGFIGVPFKPGVAAWLTDPENIKTLQAMLLVTHFQNVPDDEIFGGMTHGTPDRLAAHTLMSEFFL